MSQLSKTVKSGQYTLLRYLTFIICLGTTAMSYYGYQSLSPTLEGRVMASVMAVSTLACMYLYHSFVIKALIDNVSLKKRLLVLGLAAVFFIFVIGLSSAINVAAISGKSAQIAYISDFEKDLNSTATRIYQQANAIRQFLPLFDQEQSSWQQFAEDEKRSGSFTKTAGTGAVHSVFLNYARHFSVLHSQTEAYLQQVEASNTQVKAQLAQIREFKNGSGSPEERMQLIGQAVDDVNELLISMQGHDLINGFEVIINNLPNEMSIITLSGNASVAKGQQLAVNKIKERLHQTTGLIRSKFADYQKESVMPELPQLRPMTTLVAVVEYWYLYPQAWLAGIALDLAPIFLAVVLLILSPHPKEEQLHPFKIMTVQELIDARVALHQLGLSSQEYPDQTAAVPSTPSATQTATRSSKRKS